MGSVYRKTYTKPLPKNAEKFAKNGEQFVRWRDRRGKPRTAKVTKGKDGSERIAEASPYFIAKYRDGNDTVVEVSTGCRHEDAARRVLADLERQAELIRSGVVTKAEAATAKHNAAPIESHLTAYETHLVTKGSAEMHLRNTLSNIRRVALDCGFISLADLERDALEHWLASRIEEGMSARSRNAYRTALVSFCSWCVKTKRLTVNPFLDVARADEQSDPRRQRRALTEEELTRLLAVARQRPLIDAETVRRGRRAGERVANVKPEERERLDLLGRERALIYKVLVLSGLRKNELASLTVGALHLDEPVPFAVLAAADEKNRQGSEIALRDDLAADLRDWLADKLQRIQRTAIASGAAIPARLPSDTPLFVVPDGLVRILDRDLKQAGIDKRDDRGRTIDVHALRHTFATMLSKGGVSPRTAQAALRHSDIKLTMNTYTDPRLLDVAGSLDVLPSLPLDKGSEIDRKEGTGTDAER